MIRLMVRIHRCCPMIDLIDKEKLRAELVGAHCELNHGRWCDASECPAVDHLVIPLGYKRNEVESEVTDFMTIPICKDCADTLYSQDPDWNLFFCIGCSYNEWRLKAVAINYSEEMIIFSDRCKNCDG